MQRRISGRIGGQRQSEMNDDNGGVQSLVKSEHLICGIQESFVEAPMLDFTKLVKQ